MLMLDYQNNARPGQRLGIAVLLVAVTALLALAADYYDLAAGIADLSSANLIERAARQGSGAGREDKEAQAQAGEIVQANRVLRELSVPWDTLFKTIEDVGGKDVTLLALQPEAEKRAVKIVGEARNFVAAVDYLRRLQQQPVLYDVYLQHHQVEQQDAEKPVRFTIMAAWRAEP